MINKFKDIFYMKRKEIDSKIVRLRKGVKQITDARESVIKMEMYLKDLKPRLEISKKETSEILEKVRIDYEVTN